MPESNSPRSDDSLWARPDSPIDWQPSSAAVSQTSYGNEARPLRPKQVVVNPSTPLPTRAILVGVLLTVAAVILVTGLVFLTVGGLSNSGSVTDDGPFSHGLSGVPELARLCPPPSGAASLTPGPAEPVPGGPRITDEDAGISYSELPDPFHRWDLGSWNQGKLGVEFGVGYYFVTEQYVGGDYFASVLSGKVPATVGDSLTLNLECAGKQITEDVRAAYYPQPNEKQDQRVEYTTVGGRPAWVSVFHLSFETPGLQARGETVAVVTVDVGRPNAAVLYISIPDTHRQYSDQISSIINSIRPTG